MSDRRIDDALEAWPDIKAPDENALAEKTMNRIRANFPPKSKLTLTDDALVTSPFPATGDDQPGEDWQTKTRERSSPDDTIEQTPIAADLTPPVGIYVERHRESLIDNAELENGDDVENVDASELETTPETKIDPFADATQEIRPSQAALKKAADQLRQENFAKGEISREREKSSLIGVPIARASSIPPPSSGVARSEKAAAPPEQREPSQKKAEGSMGQVERQRDRTSFKDLAKLAATPPPSSAKPASAKVPVATPSSSSGLKGDSGVVDLQAAALSDPQGAERAKSTPLASGSLFDEEGPASGRPSGSQEAPPPSMSGEHPSSGVLSAAHSVPQQIDPYSPASVRPSAPPAALSAGRLSSAGPHSAVAAIAQTPQKTGSKSRVGIILVSLVGVAAIAAGSLFYVKTHHAPIAPVAANDSTPAQSQAAAQPVAQNNDQAAPQNAAAATDSVSANALPIDDPNLVAAGGAKSAVKSPGHATSKSGKPSMAKDSFLKTESDTPSPTPAPDTKAAPVATKDEAPPPVGGSANLQNAMQTAAGPSDSTSTQAAATGPKFAPGSVPQRPSQGALSSAIGRSLPDARACLGPDDGVSYATVVFESGGGVQNVTLSGFAANKPAGACITTALKKASVGPFAEPTYTAKITVRP